MQMSLVGQLFGFKAFVASQRLVHSFLCCSRKTFSECLSTECVNQYKASTSSPPPWVTPLGVWTSEDWFVQIPIFLVKKKKDILFHWKDFTILVQIPCLTRVTFKYPTLENAFFSNVYFLGTDYSQVPKGGWGGGGMLKHWIDWHNKIKKKIKF